MTSYSSASTKPPPVTASQPQQAAAVSSSSTVAATALASDKPATQQQQQQQQLEPDIVTQLQTCLGQLTTQFYASVNYITTRHPLSFPQDPNLPAGVGGDPTVPPQSGSRTPSNLNGIAVPPTGTAGAASGPGQGAGQSTTAPPLPVDNEAGAGSAASLAADHPEYQPVPTPYFKDALRELAQDLVIKTRQIESLAAQLPDLRAESVHDTLTTDGSKNDMKDGSNNAGGEQRLGEQARRQDERLRQLIDELQALSGEADKARQRRELAKRKIESVAEVWGSSRQVGR